MAELREKHISAIDGEPDLEVVETTRDAGDIKSVKAAEKETKTAEQLSDEFVRTMMLDQQGRRWFFELLSLCGIMRNPFSTDPLRTAFDCGQMNIGQQVFAQLQRSCPDLYLKMMDEAK